MAMAGPAAAPASADAAAADMAVHAVAMAAAWQGGAGSGTGQVRSGHALMSFQIWIGIAKACQDFDLQALHFLGLIIFNVVKSKKMQAAVDDEMSGMLIKAFFLLGSFLFEYFHGNDQVSKVGALSLVFILITAGGCSICIC